MAKTDILHFDHIGADPALSESAFEELGWKEACMPSTLPANNESTAHHPQGDQLGEFEIYELFPQASYPGSMWCKAAPSTW